MGVYDDLAKLETKSPTPRIESVVVKQVAKKKKPKKSKTKPVSQSADQLTNQSTGQSFGWSIDQSIDLDSLGPVVDRPRAFYITQKVDHWLDDGVRYLRSKGLHKVDRSVLVNAIMHDPEFYQPKSLDKLRERLLTHLTNKGLKRVEPMDQSIN
jgi:hypothetical protein